MNEKSNFHLNIQIAEHRTSISKSMMQLLLMGDPNETSINSYLTECKIFICQYNNACIGIALLHVKNQTFELKNIAVLPDYQNKGVAKALISHIKALAKSLGADQLEVGTGNSSLAQLSLYQKCGFRLSRIDKDFFINYHQPIYENGIRCIDMIRLIAKL